jgi:benzylsuccinate CoA-transferase BbsF subunit
MFESVFKGINITEFTLFGLGPVTGKFFSHYGATVVRVESSLRPDPTRMWPPFANDEPGVNRGGFWAHMNTGKRSVCLNLKHPKSAGVTRRLIEWSDIVIENFTPGVMERWGLGYEELKKIKPDIIMIRISNLGHTGPHATQRGTGSSLQGLAGFTNLTGWPDRGPAFPFGAISDQYPPPLAASCAIAALLHRRRTGEGQYIDFSQLECSIPFLGSHILDYVVNGRISTAHHALLHMELTSVKAMIAGAPSLFSPSKNGKTSVKRLVILHGQWTHDLAICRKERKMRTIWINSWRNGHKVEVPKR